MKWRDGFINTSGRLRFPEDFNKEERDALRRHVEQHMDRNPHLRDASITEEQQANAIGKLMSTAGTLKGGGDPAVVRAVLLSARRYWKHDRISGRISGKESRLGQKRDGGNGDSSGDGGNGDSSTTSTLHLKRRRIIFDSDDDDF